MRLGTRQECVGSSPSVLGVYQDSAKEFARRSLRLARRLSGIAEKLIGNDGPGSSLSIGPRFGRCSGISPEFARRFAEGIGKLTGNMPGDHRGENQRTCRKYVGGYRIGES
ncbi:hypothetical protein BHM03_00048117 [Ensete ventricosum]|nr:hypothetical protein BHM03_00048117 [Ensete ventricosum]